MIDGLLSQLDTPLRLILLIHVFYRHLGILIVQVLDVRLDLLLLFLIINNIHLGELIDPQQWIGLHDKLRGILIQLSHILDLTGAHLVRRDICLRRGHLLSLADGIRLLKMSKHLLKGDTRILGCLCKLLEMLLLQLLN